MDRIRRICQTGTSCFSNRNCRQCISGDDSVGIDSASQDIVALPIDIVHQLDHHPYPPRGVSKVLHLCGLKWAA